MTSPQSLNYLITGAGRGIGRGLTRILLSTGNRVFLIDNNKAELDNTLNLAATWSQTTSKNALPAYQGALVDLSKRSEMKKAMEKVDKFFKGRLNVLVNNAMATPHVWSDGKSMADDVLDEWNAKIAVGLTAPFVLSHLCIPLLHDTKQTGEPACIVNMSSTRATQAELNHEGYSAVKAGLLGLSQSMAMSLGTIGVRVNTIVPGWINVENECLGADEKGIGWNETREDKEWHPAGRVGRVEDVAKALNYLVQSDFVTGEELVVSGGVERKMVYPE